MIDPKPGSVRKGNAKCFRPGIEKPAGLERFFELHSADCSLFQERRSHGIPSARLSDFLPVKVLRTVSPNKKAAKVTA